MAKPKYIEWLKKENLEKIQEWAMNGARNEDIAHNMGINVSTFYAWCNEHQEFLDALKTAKEVSDIQIENALYKKALGYTVKLAKNFKIREVIYDNNGKKIKEEEKLVTAYDEQHIPADTTAQIFWLKNRKPTIWRDKVEQGISLDTPIGVIIENEFKQPDTISKEKTD